MNLKSKPTFQALSKKVGMAAGDYDLIKEGDKILIAVSGGKDSLTMAELLKYRQSFAPVHFELSAVFVDFGFTKGVSKHLKEFLKELDIPLKIIKAKLQKKKGHAKTNCFWCSWNRRKAIFQLADKIRYNKIALGHHMDDIVETILMNLFYHGQISAMKPKQELFDGKLAVIRPLAYIQEKEIEKLAKTKQRKFPHCNCPNNDTSKRAVIKQLIKQLGKKAPHVKKNIFKSVKRVKEDYLL